MEKSNQFLLEQLTTSCKCSGSCESKCILRKGAPKRSAALRAKSTGFAELHGAHAETFPSALRAARWLAELGPGDLLFIPCGWLHEVHTLSPSFSLGWRVKLSAGLDAEPTLRASLAQKRAAHGAIQLG